jgi:citrate lyase subunit beta / citryl-CoA lyase
MRSFLFVPADDPRKLARAAQSAAHALVFDLEDAVMPERKAAARQMLAEWARSGSEAKRFWVRINEPESAAQREDLAAVVPLRPVGVVLPKIRGPEDIRVVSNYLAMAETIHGIPFGTIRIIAVCTETPLAVLRTREIAELQCNRLAGLMWGGEDLSSAVGADDPRAGDGSWRPMYQHARNQCLLAARALDVLAIDTVYVEIKNAEGCRRSALESRSDGFDAKVAIHPDQAIIINEAFTPTPEHRARAERIVEAFAGSRGAVLFEGKMLDIPHLKAARRLLQT